MPKSGVSRIGGALVPSKFKRVVVSLFVPAILLVITACPGVILSKIDVSFIPGNFVGATGIFECFSPITPDALAYNWSFGDGNSAQGQLVTHSYSAPGTYDVKCSVATERSVFMFSTTVTIVSFTGGGVLTPIHAYWGDGAANTIRRCDVAGALPCTSEIVADASSGVDFPYDILVDGTDMYWTDFGNKILKCDLTGGFPCVSEVVAQPVTPRPDQPPLFVHDPRGLAIQGTTLYWVNEGNNNIRACDISGALPCASTDIELIANAATSGVDGPDELVIDGDRLIWTQDFREIRSCSLSGSTPCQSELLANSFSPIKGNYGIASVAGFLFWFDAFDNTIYACDLDSTPCTGVVFADGPTSGVSFPSSVDFRGFTMYWSNKSQIRSCDLIGADTPCQSIVNMNGDVVTSSIEVK